MPAGRRLNDMNYSPRHIPLWLALASLFVFLLWNLSLYPFDLSTTLPVPLLMVLSGVLAVASVLLSSVLLARGEVGRGALIAALILGGLLALIHIIIVLVEVLFP